MIIAFLGCVISRMVIERDVTYIFEFLDKVNILEMAISTDKGRKLLAEALIDAVDRKVAA